MFCAILSPPEPRCCPTLGLELSSYWPSHNDRLSTAIERLEVGWGRGVCTRPHLLLRDYSDVATYVNMRIESCNLQCTLSRWLQRNLANWEWKGKMTLSSGPHFQPPRRRQPLNRGCPQSVLFPEVPHLDNWCYSGTSLLRTLWEHAFFPLLSLFLEVEYELLQWERVTEECPLLRGCPFLRGSSVLQVLL